MRFRTWAVERHVMVLSHGSAHIAACACTRPARACPRLPMPGRGLRLRLACGAALGIAAAQAHPAATAHPASAHCAAQGGEISVERDASGGSFGVCRFADNRQCEAWALLRGACPIGGLKITGDTTPAARYCALHGGRCRLLSAGAATPEQGSCTFASGRSCAAQALFSGPCTALHAGEIVHALYRCTGGAAVDAVFSNSTTATSVSLAMSDGRMLALRQAISASGARYANADESFRFWIKGRDAFIDERGKPGRVECRPPD